MTEVRLPRIAFTTLGCKVNQSETDLLARQFAAAGYRCVAFEDSADVYVVNTCTVTHVADRKSRQVLNDARRTNPNALVVATGCYASIAGDALGGDRTLVIRNRDKDRVVELVDGRLRRETPASPSFTELDKYLEISGGQDRTRATVKAQDGCDSHCAYCIIPRARGRSRSVPPDAVVRRVRALAVEGHAEVVITGVDLGSYGEDDPSFPDLGGLLRRVLLETDVPRVRVSSVEPGDFNLQWLDVWRETRMCRHLHVPLQAGSAGVLHRMERKYAPREFAAMVDACRAAIPGVTITTDVITGFPGETEDEFEEGRAFIAAMRFDGMHVFKYSQRSGTRAARLPDQVPERVKATRSELLRTEAIAGVDRLLGRHVGAVASIAWEAERGGIRQGTTDTNVRVYGPAEGTTRGALHRLRLVFPYRDGLWADPLHPEITLLPTSGATAQH
jgi:threonylcarbamoyladenosine tRNA methylthiotransferase MtaB